MAGIRETEVWAKGTHAELERVRAGLGAVGRIVQEGDPHPLHGAERGRYRQYLRVAVRS